MARYGMVPFERLLEAEEAARVLRDRARFRAAALVRRSADAALLDEADGRRTAVEVVAAAAARTGAPEDGPGGLREGLVRAVRRGVLAVPARPAKAAARTPLPASV